MNYTRRIPLSLTALCALGIAALTPNAAQAAGSLLGNYYKLKADAPNQNPDVNTHPITGLVTGRVKSTLGPDGLPVSNDMTLNDVNGSGEILWWTPDGTDVFSEKTQIDAAPLNFPANFFPDGQNSDDPYTRAVHWCGDFTLPGATSVPMSLAADDDAWVFIDNTLQVDNGGIKPIGAVTNTLVSLGAGNHHIDIFFADRQRVQSGIEFSAGDIHFTPCNCDVVPEPCSLALLALGGGPLLAARRRRK